MNKITKKILSIAVASAVALSFTGFLSMDSEASGDCGYKLSGMAHVQDQGDTPGTFDSSTGILTLGTRGMSRRVEAISIKIDETPEGLSGGISYTAHVQDYGWLDYVSMDGDMCGTSGESKRLEAVEIWLYGELADYYTVQYQVHIQDYGDAQGFVNEYALAGTTGESKRLEEVQIKLVKRDPSNGAMSVNYRVHVQDKGWEATYAKDGESSGTTGEAKRLEGIEIFLSGSQYQGWICYRTHIQDYGWETLYSSDGEMSGTQGQAKRLEAIQIELYGEIEDYYDIYYRVHSQDYGWLGWAKNGDPAGTAGKGLRLESIQIKLVPKGDPAPGSTENSFIYNEFDTSSLGATSANGKYVEWINDYAGESFNKNIYLGTSDITLYSEEIVCDDQICKFYYSTDSKFTDNELSNPIGTSSLSGENYTVLWSLIYIDGKPVVCNWVEDTYDNRDYKPLPSGYYMCIVCDGSGNELCRGTCYMM